MFKTDLFRRYEKACTLEQQVDPDKVAFSLRRFFKGIGVSITVRKVGSFKAAQAAQAAGAARAAWDAQAARAAWDARAAQAAGAARAAWDAQAARAAWDARAAQAAGDAWAAWDAGYISCLVLGAEEICDTKERGKWLGWFEAFESGCWTVFPFDTEVIWIRIPKLLRDAQNRAHADGKPAVTLPDEQWYFWHGTLIPDTWGKINSEHWEPQWLLETENAEQRRVLIQGLGYERIKTALPTTVLHQDRDMELVQIAKDVDVEPIVVLKVVCPSTTHPYVLRVPPTMTTCEQARRWTLHDERNELEFLKET